MPLAEVQNLVSFQLALLSMLKGTLSVHSAAVTGTDLITASVGHRALSNAGYLHGNISPEHLAVSKHDHTEGVLIGFSNAIEAAQPGQTKVTTREPHRCLNRDAATQQHLPHIRTGARITLLVHQLHRSELPQGAFNCHASTAPWHQGCLENMANAKTIYWYSFGGKQEPAFIKFSQSLGASHAGFFDFMLQWASALERASATHTPPPDFTTVVGWLQESIDSYSLSR